jgi:hypothetical protein
MQSDYGWACSVSKRFGIGVVTMVISGQRPRGTKDWSLIYKGEVKLRRFVSSLELQGFIACKWLTFIAPYLTRRCMTLSSKTFEGILV